MTLKEHLKTPKGRLVAALCVLGISWIFLIIYFVGPLNSLFPTREAIDAKKAELLKLQKENSALKLRMKQHTTLEQGVKAVTDRAWQEKDGMIEMDLRSRVQGAAEKAGLTLNSLGSVKLVKVNNDLSFAEIDVQGSAPIDMIAAFLTQIQGIKPVLSWKRFDLRMDMRPRRTDMQTAEQTLSFNGTLRLLYAGKQEVRK